MNMFFDTPLFKTINHIKEDPNYTEDRNQVVQYATKNQSSTIITPFAGENNIFFKLNKVIRHVMECGEYLHHNYEKRERYLQINANGSINILNKDFNQVNESITDYFYSQEALSLKDKWLAAGEFKLWEKDFGDNLILYYTHKEKDTEVEVNLYIDRKGEISIRTTVSSPGSMHSAQYEVPKDRADSFNFSYQSLATYFLEKQAEKLQHKGNMPSPL